MSNLNENIVRNIIKKTSVPLVLRGFVSNWSICQYNEKDWCSEFGDRKLPLRCFSKSTISDEPCWERKCSTKNLTFKEFIKTSSGDEWMYFDYKYMHQWFHTDSQVYKEISWAQFGFPDKGAVDTTLWIGSSGAHTPAHQDTYGVNVIAQIYGKKRWILFPPESGGMKPTRVPYEESSIYSEINFYSPSNLEVFSGLVGGRYVELSAGDALIVPRRWWHYVQNIDPLNIALNTWLPHEKDVSAQVSEALIKIFVAQISKDLPEDTAKLLINPNEDDISDTPLAVLFLQLETVANTYLSSRRKARRLKLQRTSESGPAPVGDDEIDINTFLNDKANTLEIVPSISSEELVNLVKNNLREVVSANRSSASEADEVDAAASLRLTKAVVEAFCQSNVIDIVKQNLFNQLS